MPLTRGTSTRTSLSQLYGFAGSWSADDHGNPPASNLATWRDVFADPLGIRENAAKALDRPECLSPNKDPEMSCSASDIAKLAMLHHACTDILYWHRGFGGDSVPNTPDALLDEAWWAAIDRLDQDVALTVEEYSRRRLRIEDERFRFAWRLRRCHDMPKEALSSLEAFPAPSGRPGHRHQGRDLTEAAARLGNEWARRELEQDQELREERFSRRTGYPPAFLSLLETAAEQYARENPNAPSMTRDPETGAWIEDNVVVVRYHD